MPQIPHPAAESIGMWVDAGDIEPGDVIRWAEETFTVETVRSDGSLRHVHTAERLSLVFHSLERLELAHRHTGRTAA